MRDCSSIHRCRICQKPHHSLLHSESEPNSSLSTSPNPVQVHTASGLVKELLFMTCRLRVESPEGFSIKARGILDSVSSASFVSERLTQTLRLKRSNCNARISSSTQSIASFTIAPIHSPKKMNLSAIVVPQVTCDLPVVPIPLDPSWSHISNLRLGDLEFAKPGRVDILLGVDVFAGVLCQGRRCGPSHTPTAFETEFGWVLAGSTTPTDVTSSDVFVHHAIINSCDDLLRLFTNLHK